MARFAVLRVTKLKKFGNISGSSKHGFRERETHNADPTKLADNRILCGPSTSRGVRAAIDRSLQVVTHRSPKDPVLCLEYLISYSPEALAGAAPAEYFADSLKWLQDRHGKENIVSAIVHHDETTPHLAAYAVPIERRGGRERKRNVADGRNPDGSQRRKTITSTVGAEVWLSAAAYVGSRPKLRKLQTDFAKEVGAKFGLERGVERSGARHITIKQFYAFLNGEVPDLLAPEVAKLAKAAASEATRQKAAAEAARKRTALLEKQLTNLRARLDEQTRDATEQLAEQQRLSAEALRQQATVVEKLRGQLVELKNWISTQLGTIWTALFNGGVPAVRELILRSDEESPLELVPIPENRVDVREMATGEWRAAVLDDRDVEVWSEVYSDEDEAYAGADAWIRHADAPAPGM
ncbi:MAG: MobV family relaxase [Lysobacterales bacterium]